MSGFIVNRPQWQPAYNASKAAVHHLTRSLAAEWAPHGVRVNALAPGYIKTDMSPVDDPQFRQHWIEDAPMQRYGTVEELAPSRRLPGQRRLVVRHRLGARGRRRLHRVLTSRHRQRARQSPRRRGGRGSGPAWSARRWPGSARSRGARRTDLFLHRHPAQVAEAEER